MSDRNLLDHPDGIEALAVVAEAEKSAQHDASSASDDEVDDAAAGAAVGMYTLNPVVDP